jgi:hypothetical protein
MSYYRFGPTDKFVNTLRTHPAVEFVIYNGSAYYNQEITISGAFHDIVGHVSGGYLSLYEYNVDRSASAYAGGFNLPQGGAQPLARGAVGGQPLIGTAQDPTSDMVVNTGLIYPWTIKDSSRIMFKTTTTRAYNDLEIGNTIVMDLPRSSSISKEFYPASLKRHVDFDITDGAAVSAWSTYGAGIGYPPNDTQIGYVDNEGRGINFKGSISYLYALKNTINYYRRLSPHFAVSSSIAHSGLASGRGRDLTASSGVDGGLGAIDVGMVSIPAIFFGSGIKKGSVSLKYYVTGTLHGELQDKYKNGELIEVFGASADKVAGIVLYNEGFIILTGSWDMSPATVDDYIDAGSDQRAKWIYFGQSISGSTTAPSSSFVMQFSGTNKTQVLTMFATAPMGEANNSANFTFLSYSSGQIAWPTQPVRSGSGPGYIESDKQTIKNVVSSSYNDPTGSFKKTTYISKVGIYDEDKNLIAIAKVATPVKKTENRDITFKLKLDF